MLFRILKLFGLDVPAKIAAVKTGLEQRHDNRRLLRLLRRVQVRDGVVVPAGNAI
jgi:hypothetical protein